MSKLNLLVEDFLIIQQLNSDTDDKELRRFQLYNNRNLYQLANTKAEALKVKWYNSKSIGLKKVNLLLQLHHSIFFSENPIIYDKENLVLETLFNAFNDFNFIYSELYEYAIEKHININLNKPQGFKDKSLSDQYLIQEVSKIVININRLYKKNDFNSFQYLHNKLESNKDISLELKSLIFGVCEVYLYNAKRNQESNVSLKTILNLYQLGLSQRILLYDNCISTIKFQNILSVACFLKDFDWTEKYIMQYTNLLPMHERKENLIFIKIKVQFEKLEYKSALNLLTISEFINFSLRTQSRWYLLSIYFIIYDNIDFIKSQINSFNQYCYYNKKRLSPRNFTGSLNLSKIFNSAVSNKRDFNLNSEINKYENITFKDRLESIFEQRKNYKKKNGIDL